MHDHGNLLGNSEFFVVRPLIRRSSDNATLSSGNYARGGRTYTELFKRTYRKVLNAPPPPYVNLMRSAGQVDFIHFGSSYFLTYFLTSQTIGC